MALFDILKKKGHKKRKVEGMKIPSAKGRNKKEKVFAAVKEYLAGRFHLSSNSTWEEVGERARFKDESLDARMSMLIEKIIEFEYSGIKNNSKALLKEIREVSKQI